MSMQAIDEIAAELVREAEIILPGRVEAVLADAPLEGLGFDSMSFVEMLIFVEKKYGVRLMEMNLSAADMRSLRSLAERIHQVR